MRNFKRKDILVLLGILIVVFGVVFLNPLRHQGEQTSQVLADQESYWFVLHRASNTEDFLRGVPGDRQQSSLIKQFVVKSGIPGERPTPLPQLLGRQYWLITEMHPEPDNPETAPYFITLNVPAPTGEPYGPVPYTECNGEQCNWVTPGSFGLHGSETSGSISSTDPGSSGCIRHTDEDITYLYNTLKPEKGEIRYYVEDN